jgi:hypothetical protein
MATRRNLWLAGALLGLVVLVAVASRGHSPAGGGETHGVDSNLVWEFILIGFFGLFLLCLPVAIWVVVTTRLDAPPDRRRKKHRTVGIAIALAIFLFAVVVAAERYYANNNHGNKQPKQQQLLQNGPIKPNKLGKKVPFDWLPAIVILSIAGVGGARGAALCGPRRLARRSARREGPAPGGDRDLRADGADARRRRPAA